MTEESDDPNNLSKSEFLILAFIVHFLKTCRTHANSGENVRVQTVLIDFGMAIPKKKRLRLTENKVD